MADFVNVLKKTIAAQRKSTLELRQRIYARARETVEKKLAESSLAPELIELQHRILEKAISEVEKSYHSKQEIDGASSEASTVDREQGSDQEKLSSVRVSFSENVEKLQAENVFLSQKESLLQSVLGEKKPEQTANDFRKGKNPVGILSLGSAIEKYSKKNKNDFSMFSGIFAQTVRQGKERSGKKQVLVLSSMVVVILSLFMVIIWFLTVVTEMQSDIIVDHLENKKPIAKIMQRLMPNGEETNPGLLKEWDQEKSKNTADHLVMQTTSKVLYREEQTALLPETIETGNVKWSLLYEEYEGEQDNRKAMIIRGDISIPDKSMRLRMVIRPNNDPSIPAAFLVKLLFMIPKDFYGGAVDRIGQLLLKASDLSAGQELHGIVQFKIDENFFILAMDAPGPLLRRNLKMMCQSPWIKLNIVYKTGQRAEFFLVKGDGGDSLFKKMLNFTVNYAKTENRE
ncbi:MAG: hypothetical protein JSC085_000303 [Candidatus Tokpelaia sp. JSC085]|nr:MAG: hypothetical protein JSC085_000303 [Candidatus Tokpelaia sp. JSC085]